MKLFTETHRGGPLLWPPSEEDEEPFEPLEEDEECDYGTENDSVED